MSDERCDLCEDATTRVAYFDGQRICAVCYFFRVPKEFRDAIDCQIAEYERAKGAHD